MEKNRIESSPEITSEAKSEMQELLNELFVDNLNSKITKINSQSNENYAEISNIRKISKNNFSIITDKLDSLQESIICLGDKDEWGDETIVSFLNVLAKIINDCKTVLDDRTECLNSEWKDGPLELQLSKLECQGANILNKIDSIHRDNIGVRIDRLYNEIKQIDGIIGKLSILENGIDSVLSNFSGNGTIGSIISVQNRINTDLHEISEKLEIIKSDSKNSFDSLIEKIIDSNNKFASFDKDLNEIRQNIVESSETIEKIIEDSEKRIEGRVMVLISGIGVSLLLNIILITMMIMKWGVL